MPSTSDYNKQLQDQATPRAKRVYEENKAGKSFKEIGADMGISAERARQLAARYKRQQGIANA